MRRPPLPRPDLDDLRAYSTSSTTGGEVFLHANENPYPLPDSIAGEIAGRVRELELNRYPDPSARGLREALADYAGVDASWVWPGTGSNEVLLQACLAYGGPGRTAMLFEPTYRMHHRQARIAGTSVVDVPRRPDFSIDVETALASIEAREPDVIFLCSPNNPTGTLTALEDVRAIAAAAPGLVVLDEAYFEFCGVTLVPELPTYPNVVVVRTLSKAFRLAGARIGYLIGGPEVLEPLERVRMPYSVSAPAQAIAEVVLAHRDEVLACVPEIVSERDRISAALAELPGMEVFGSASNSILFRHPDAAGLFKALVGAGIVVRDFTTLRGCEGCLRVTVGLPEQNDAFLETLREAVG